MRASSLLSARSTWFSLVAAALALTVWGVTLFASPQASPDTALRPPASMQLADGGGATRPGG